MNFLRWTFALAFTGLFASCSQQGEGERCVAANGNADCASGLQCQSAEFLENERNSKFAADRCCPEKNWSDSRCQPRRTSQDDMPNNTAGAPATNQAGAAGLAGAAGVGGGDDRGVAGSSGAASGVGGSAGSAGVAGQSIENAGAAGTVG